MNYQLQKSQTLNRMEAATRQYRAVSEEKVSMVKKVNTIRTCVSVGLVPGCMSFEHVCYLDVVLFEGV